MDAEGDWHDLQTKGYVVVRRFLSEADVDGLATTYQSAPALGNKNYSLTVIPRAASHRYTAAIDHVLSHVRENTDIHVNTLTAAFFFATDRPDFSYWHQDHEDFYQFQEHYHNLNLWIPVVKPNRAKSNLRIIPFDTLVSRAPLGSRLIRCGATELYVTNGQTTVIDNSRGGSFVLNCDVNDLATTPELDAGDLLVIRGDMIHATQDLDTRRVAASFRLHDSCSVVSKDRLVAGGLHKLSMMLNNPERYGRVLQAFVVRQKNDLSIAELLPFLDGTTPTSPTTAFQLLSTMIGEKMRAAASAGDMGSLEAELKSGLCWCNRCSELSRTLSKIDALRAH